MMKASNGIPWDEVNDFLLKCGDAANPGELAQTALESIDSIVPFDLGRIYSIGVNGEVCDDILLGVDQRWPREYSDYYSKILDNKYSLFSRTVRNGYYSKPRLEDCFYDWSIQDSVDEFVEDYIRPQKIHYSFGFGLHDMRPVCKRACMIDRAGHVGFSEDEMKVLSVIVPHIDNLHRNFYISTDGECAVGRVGADDALTERESEIAKLICEGYAPERIAKSLFISRATVYKHIAHIHTKIGVTNRQELVVKLLHNYA